MGIAQIGVPGLILILVLAMVIFGPKKLPEIGKAAGETLKEFKSSADDMINEDEQNNSKEQTQNESQKQDTTY